VQPAFVGQAVDFAVAIKSLYDSTMDNTCLLKVSKDKIKLSQVKTLIIVLATPGHFFQSGKNSLSLKQLAGLPKTPRRGRNDDQSPSEVRLAGKGGRVIIAPPCNLIPCDISYR
jgi:hypothetical protein